MICVGGDVACCGSVNDEEPAGNSALSFSLLRQMVPIMDTEMIAVPIKALRKKSLLKRRRDRSDDAR